MIVVKAAFDPGAQVWFVESSDLPGLNLEAPTLDELRAKNPPAVIDVVEAAGDPAGDFDIPAEIIALASARAQGHVLAA